MKGGVTEEMGVMITQFFLPLFLQYSKNPYPTIYRAEGLLT